jgi:hypothetical protein
VASVFDIFVVGGVPTATYNPRADRRLAADLENIAKGRHTLGALHGPTKCGKSVLIVRTLPEATRIDGGDLQNVDSFWFQLASKLGLPADERSSFEYTESTEGSLGIEVGIAPVKVNAGASTGGVIKRGREWGSKSLPDRVVEALRERTGTVVIDDFHHAPDAVRHDIVRVLKKVLFEGVPVVLASVSHRAFDSVLAEPEMDGRVDMIEVPEWGVDELAAIGLEGFSALNVQVAPKVVNRLAEEALGSPQLMQLFCRELCLLHGITDEGDGTPVRIDDVDWQAFFAGIARKSPSVSRLNPIKFGPKERGHQRERMIANSGNEVDIYGTILLAVAQCGPVRSIAYRDLKVAIGEVLSEGNPDATQIKNTLSQQSKIAAGLVEAHEFVDPVIYWDGDVLHVIDPFFSFYVRWGDLQVSRDALPGQGVMQFSSER